MLSHVSGQAGVCARVVGAVAPIEPRAARTPNHALLAAHALSSSIDDSRVYDGQG